MATKKTTKGTKSAVNFKDSIRTKLIVVMLAIVIIPLAIAVTVSYKTSTSKAMEDAYSSLSWQAQYIQSKFESIVTNNIKTMQAVAMSPTTINYMEKQDNPIYMDKELTYMQSVDEALADGNIMVLTGADGMQVLRSKGDLVDVSQRQYFQEAMKGNVHVSDVIVSTSTGLRQTTIAVPIYGSEGGIIGIVQRNYDLNEFHKFLAEESEDAFITDRTGLVAAHAQYEITQDNEDDRSKSTFMTSGLQKGVYSTDTGRGYSAVVSYIKDPTTGWTICTASNTKVITKEATSSALIVVVIAILTLAGASVI